MDSDPGNRSIFVLAACQVTALLLRNMKETLFTVKDKSWHFPGTRSTGTKHGLLCYGRKLHKLAYANVLIMHHNQVILNRGMLHKPSTVFSIEILRLRERRKPKVGGYYSTHCHKQPERWSRYEVPLHLTEGQQPCV